MKDRFSGHAPKYATFRPRYPQALYDFLYTQVSSFDLAWDAGTGNGQAAEVLAAKFKEVLATDISSKQIEQAATKPNITYAVAGELSNLPDKSVDLVTVAQAIHWFDRKTFYAEVKRVLKPDGVIAAWGYGLLKISPEVDALITEFYTDVVGPYWDPERRLIDERLQTIEFPFEEINTPPFVMTFVWTLAELEGYLNTWSATQKFIQAKAENPVDELMVSVRKVKSAAAFPVEFPIFMRMGKV